MKIHCDKCDRELGEYLFGKGGVEEKAHITNLRNIGLPDVVCFNCLRGTNQSLTQGQRP